MFRPGVILVHKTILVHKHFPNFTMLIPLVLSIDFLLKLIDGLLIDYKAMPRKPLRIVDDG